MSSDSRHRKLVFELEQDEDGYPPIRSEGIWVLPVAGEPDVFEVDNIPFYACVAIGDRIRAVEQDGELRPQEMVRSSGHGTVRVVAEAEQLADMRRFAASCNCESELGDRMIAIDVPPTADWARLQAELAQRHARELLDYQEAILPTANTQHA